MTTFSTILHAQNLIDLHSKQDTVENLLLDHGFQPRATDVFSKYKVRIRFTTVRTKDVSQVEKAISEALDQHITFTDTGY